MHKFSQKNFKEIKWPNIAKSNETKKIVLVEAGRDERKSSAPTDQDNAEGPPLESKKSGRGKSNQKVEAKRILAMKNRLSCCV